MDKFSRQADAAFMPLNAVCSTPDASTSPACTEPIGAGMAAEHAINEQRGTIAPLSLLKLDARSSYMRARSGARWVTRYDLRLMLGLTDDKGFAVEASIRAYRALIEAARGGGDGAHYSVKYFERVRAPPSDLGDAEDGMSLGSATFGAAPPYESAAGPSECAQSDERSVPSSR